MASGFRNRMSCMGLISISSNWGLCGGFVSVHASFRISVERVQIYMNYG